MSKRSRLIDLVSSVPECKIKDVYNQIVPILEKNISIDDEPITILCCPHCGSVSIKKNGTNNGVQRFICKDCNKTFSVNTNTFFFHNRIPEEKWLEFIDYEFSGLTLKEESYYLKFSVHTCFRMRHKLYEAVSSIVDQYKVEGEIQIDGNYQKINLKGTRPQNMPRYSKRRGNTTSSIAGNSHHKVCIISAIDSKDNMFLQIAGLGCESIEKYNSCRFKFGETKLLICDSKQTIQAFANEMGAKADKIPVNYANPRHVTDDGNSLADMNQLHSEISTLITRTHGFSTRYMQKYLNFIIFKKKTKYQKNREDIASYVYELIKNTRAFTEAELVYTDYPISLKEAYFEYRYGIFA